MLVFEISTHNSIIIISEDPFQPLNLEEFSILKSIYNDDEKIVFQHFANDNRLNELLKPLCSDDDDSNNNRILLLKPGEIDRKCLLSPPPKIKCLMFDSRSAIVEPIGLALGGNTTHAILQQLVEFINSNTDSYRQLDGTLNRRGQLLRSLERRRFRVGSSDDDDACQTFDQLPTSRADFLARFVARSKPAVFRNAARSLAAFDRWSVDFLRQHGSRQLWVKANPSGRFEGVERRALWRNASGDDDVPPAVRAHLARSSDLVTARPADVNMTLGQLLDAHEAPDRLSSLDSRLPRNASFYFEYSRLDFLQQDMPSSPSFADFLEVKVRVWCALCSILYFNDDNNLF
jgi:hypothetical protein